MRNNRAQDLLSKNDEDITQADVDAMEVVGSDEQKKTFKSRYQNGPGQYRTKEANSIIDNGTAVIKGQTTFGTTKRAGVGQQVAVSYMEQQIRVRARQYYGDGNNGYTVEEALTKAAADEVELFNQQKDTKNYNLPYAVKNEPNGGVSFPFLEGRAGNVAAAEREYRDYQKMRSMVKMIGFQEVANVPHSIFSAERLEYIVQNSDKPGFKYKTSELGFQGLSAGAPMHDIVNAQLAAAGRSERIGPPPVLNGLTLAPELQSIVNDARRSYQSKLNAINVASGNTEVYKNPTLMRAGSMFNRQSGASLQSFAPQVSSVTFDTGQPGIDVFFENKQFPAVLSGTVKDIDYQVNADGSGYGHYVVIESTDPSTGKKVDVLYSHFGSKPNLQLNQTINQGQIIGIQGGSGSVQSADGTISSIDFLAPAPQGSKSMTPYSNYESLRNSIASQLQNN